ncbi:glycerophosphodiester phosphodiesterase [Paenibacillus sedimenti]|uniref:Glycerophosphodiester phosphodiesterase n=1 Tax=Paenibacillus sedimenti TaxID=2770274 RepID=A0A926KSJ2_9BACL|nr:glycerophosphodiester phosphodiesterase family protein [Paenibacillus sedimenti]MBD0381404.1 glycerophosphodiester phosphodiesterase [Paenibacillus sedimenti]
MTQRFPIITAHSGCMDMLDHTLLSVETGLRLGADVIEEDVRVTKDGVPVLAHDDEVRTVEGQEFRISQLTYAELSGLRLEVQHGEHRETTRICRLEDMLPLIRGARAIANLDLKVDESIAPVAALVNKLGMHDKVFLSGCERDRAMLAQQTQPELRKLLNTDTSLFVSMAYSDAVLQTCQDALDASCFGININYRLVRSELMECAAEKGLPVYVWTVDDEALMKHFAEMGVASITARNVLALVRVKENWQGGLS